MNQHSIISPSSSDTWAGPLGCRGSARMRDMYPETGEEREISVDGTKSHKNVEHVITTGGWENLPHPELDESYHESEEYYVNYVSNEAGSSAMFIEHRVHAPKIHEQLFGTIDCWFVKDGVLHIVDYKTGFAEVAAIDYYQLLVYALALICSDEWVALVPSVKMTIVQPRAFSRGGSVRSWSLSRDEVLSYYESIKTAAHEATSENPTLRAGKQCKYCTAAKGCKEAQVQALFAADYVNRAEMYDLPTEELSRELDILEEAELRVKNRKEALKALVKNKIEEGEFVPNFYLDTQYGNMSWDSDSEALKTLGLLTGTNLFKEKPITPLQAIKAGVPEDVVKAMSSRKPSRKLKRVNPNEIRSMFNHE